MNSSEKAQPKTPNHITKTGSTTNSQSSENKKKSLSMHADVPVWYDCCSCEAEPYWTENTEDQTSK